MKLSANYRSLGYLFALFAISACGGGGGGGGNTTPNVTRGDNFVTFESGQVRPLAMTPDGTKLLAANTPNSSLEIFTVNDAGLSQQSSVAVGVEPVAVAVLNNNQAWVVNHLSDSVSVVDIAANPPRVIRTLHVGDEPRDIVFAGAGNKFAFITTAHRGQNGPDDTPVNAQLKTPGIGRADVWVFETANLGASIGGTPKKIINLYGDTPRALAVGPLGNTVYASVFLSGNKTTTLGEDNFAKPGPTSNMGGVPQPDTGLIVQYNGTNWVDDTGSTKDLNDVTYDSKVRFSLPDHDVFVIDASVDDPVATGTSFSGVGTVLYNMLVHPTSGALYVSNTEALNLTRFEGPGDMSTTVRGHFAESRISVIKSGVVTPVHLNSHINYSQPGTQQERDKAISIPLQMAISANGNTLYATGFGAKKLVVYNVAALEGNTFDPLTIPQIDLSGGGPTGIVLDGARDKAYVLTRFDNGISIVDTASNTETAHLNMYNPEPDEVINGRKFLYDSTITSAHGDSSCGLCHVFGDFDGLAWDLGNPDEVVVSNPNGFVNNDLTVASPVFHPMKGPMTTQSFRGMRGNGPMHWRGDRVGASANTGESLELGAFKDFNVAFPGLLGNDAELPLADIQAYAEFVLHITYPPNPIRALDNNLTTDQAAGRNIYLNENTTGDGTFPSFFQCNTCHVLNPANSNFGTAGLSSVEGEDVSQQFKVPHLRNMYQKVGKFGNSGKFSNDTIDYGDQIKGFGFMHDGGMDTIDKFLSGGVFRFHSNDTINATKRSQVVDFVMVMDSEMAPVMGQQVTLSASSGTDVNDRIDLLRARAQVTSPRPECDLIVKGVINNEMRGAMMRADGSYQTDRQAQVFSDTQLRALVVGNDQKLTFTCVPPGSGTWMGIDHDEDGVLDRDELDDGTDPLGS